MIRKKKTFHKTKDGTVVEKRVLVYYCDVCGNPASYGFGSNIAKGKEGLWACKEHKEAVEEKWKKEKEL